MSRKSWIVVLVLGLVSAGVFWWFSRSFMGMSVTKMGLEPGMGMMAPSMGMAEDVAISRNSAGMMVDEMMPPVLPRYGGDALQEPDRDYEYYSSYEVVVNNVSEYMSNLKAYVTSIDGRVINSSMSSRGDISSGSLYLKVPVADFDATNAQVTNGVDEVMSESVTSADVTGTTVSLQERRQNLEEELLELQAELEEATTDLERNRIELQIDRVERQLENLVTQEENQEERVTYATVNVFAASDEDYFDPRGRYTEPDLADQVEMAWEMLWYMLQKVLVLIVWVGVFSIVWLPVVLLVVWLKKRGKKPQSKE